MTPILGVAVWGLGKHSINRVLPAINSSDTVKLVGVTSRDATVGSAIAENFGCLYWKNPRLIILLELLSGKIIK